MQHRKRGNPYHFPKKRRRRQDVSALKEQCVLSTVAHPSEPVERARLTLHESDPITGNEDSLYTLFYEWYRGYTIYSTEQGRCCIHSQQGCLRVRGRFACFPDVEEAKKLIKWLRAAGYTASDPVEREVPASAYMCLNRHEPLWTALVSGGGRGQACHRFLPHQAAATKGNTKETGL